MAMISTRGRYALRVMADLAAQATGAFIPLMDIAQRQEISEKYLEGIVAALSKRGLVEAQRGRGGGYRLAREPQAYTVGEVLSAAECSLAPVACLERDAPTCPRARQCVTLPLWQRLEALVSGFLDRVTLAELIRYKF